VETAIASGTGTIEIAIGTGTEIAEAETEIVLENVSGIGTVVIATEIVLETERGTGPGIGEIDETEACLLGESDGIVAGTVADATGLALYSV